MISHLTQQHHSIYIYNCAENYFLRRNDIYYSGVGCASFLLGSMLRQPVPKEIGATAKL